MNCQNCKHWVFNKCMITGSYITADKLCNAWELSVSFNQSQKSNSTPENATELLKDNIAELEHELSNKEIEYADLWNDALALQSRIAELEGFIGKLIEVSEKMFTAVIAAADSYDEGMREWDKIVNDWKEG